MFFKHSSSLFQPLQVGLIISNETHFVVKDFLTWGSLFHNKYIFFKFKVKAALIGMHKKYYNDPLQ